MVEDVSECAGLRKSESVRRRKALGSSELISADRINPKALAMLFYEHKVTRFIRS